MFLNVTMYSWEMFCLVVSFFQINAARFDMVFSNAVKFVHLYVSLKSPDSFWCHCIHTYIHRYIDTQDGVDGVD